VAPHLQVSLVRMPSLETKYFGTLPYAHESVFDFPQGLPAFEEEKSFVLIGGSKGHGPNEDGPKGDGSEGVPLVFLQSMARASLCFAAFPILAVDNNYQLAITPEDLEGLGLATARQPMLGAEVMVLALVSLHDELLATANLMAPVVLNVETRCGLQAIRRDSRYSHEHPIVWPAAHENATEGAC
jgi:flagellar assembly factor FliW